MRGQYVQFGSGFDAPQGWVNFDSSPTLFFERLPVIGRLYTKNAKRFPDAVRYGDIVKGLPIAPNSCKGVFCSHVLEHLALMDCDRALANTYRYLMPGGVFRLVVPDIEKLARDYLSDLSDVAALHFMEASGLGRKQRSRDLVRFLRDWLGNSAHLWLWDEKAMAARLMGHGFLQVRRATFGDAEDSKFNDVEQRLRFEGCLAMQCGK